MRLLSGVAWQSQRQTDLRNRSERGPPESVCQAIPIFLQSRAGPHAIKSLKPGKRVVDKFLGLEDFKDRVGYGGKDFQFTRAAFELTTRFGLARLVEDLSKYFPEMGSDYRLAAEANAVPTRSFALFDTHKPMIQPLTFAPVQRTYFYGTRGCWSLGYLPNGRR